MSFRCTWIAFVSIIFTFLHSCMLLPNFLGSFTNHLLIIWYSFPECETRLLPWRKRYGQCTKSRSYYGERRYSIFSSFAIARILSKPNQSKLFIYFCMTFREKNNSKNHSGKVPKIGYYFVYAEEKILPLQNNAWK